MDYNKYPRSTTEIGLELSTRDSDNATLKVESKRLKAENVHLKVVNSVLKRRIEKDQLTNAQNPPGPVPPSPPTTPAAPEVVKNPLSAVRLNRSESSAPLTGADLELFLYFFLELMRPRKPASSLPSCDKFCHEITKTDCTSMTKGFNFLSNHLEDSEAEKDAVGALFKLHPAMSELNERHPVFEDILVFVG
ncbi:hypothetical protein TrLO_g1417 [Triparma laevis f. longispina]|uniref:Uncharacterized protein n=1 Tax=Triparma laevis f. longispina TaxID=1714387 RepID=A0A9W7KYN1_9STRA|nr:hypothetical protein TrLO_g1417 [Triparma laevis f. longispina]